jgi:hypothetical protein
MLSRAVHATVIGLAATFAMAAPAHASARICLPVLATGVGRDLGNLTTEATVSSFNIPLGTTHATFVPDEVTPTALTFHGPIVFTSRIGTLTAQSDGSVNLATGEFVSQSNDLSGTGAFRGVTGSLRFAGTEAPDLTFTERITGRLCAQFG